LDADDKETELRLQLKPRYDEAGEICGVIVAASPPRALRVASDGVVIECSDEAAELLGMDVHMLMGSHIMDLITESEEAVSRCISGVIDDAEFPAILDASPFTGLDGEHGALVLLEDDSKNVLKHMGYNKRPQGDDDSSKDDVSLVDGGDWEGAEISKFEVEKVVLKKGKIRGALGHLNQEMHASVEMKSLKDEEANRRKQRAFDEMSAGSSVVTLATFRQFVRSHNTRNIPALKRLNQFDKKQVTATFDDMAQGKDQADQQMFEQWWASAISRVSTS